MSVESYLSKQLQKFTIIDYGFVKLVYFFFGALIFHLYPPLGAIAWWFYLILFIFAIFPLEVHLFSQDGNLLDKMHQYLKTNDPSNQMLLALSIFFFACMMCTLIPWLASFYWWVYVILIAILAAKPMTKTWFW